MVNNTMNKRADGRAYFKNKIAQIGILKLFTILIIVLMSSTFIFTMAATGDELTTDSIKEKKVDPIKEKAKDKDYVDYLRNTETAESIGTNTKFFFPETNRVEIINKKMKPLLNMTWTTPYENSVGVSSEEEIACANINFINKKVFATQTIEQTKTYDKKNNFEEINKTFKLKIKRQNEVEDCYNQINNQTNLSEQICNTYNQTELIPINDLNEVDYFPQEVCWYTDTKDGDNNEFVFRIGDFWMYEFASWNASLNNQIVSYYEFDEGTGSLIDYIGTSDLTESGTVGNNSGIINSSRGNFSDSNYFSLTTHEIDVGTDVPFSINGWFKIDTDGTAQQLWKLDAVDTTNDFHSAVSIDTNNKVCVYYGHRGGNTINNCYSSVIPDNEWFMISAVLNSSKSVNLCINSVCELMGTYTGSSDSDASALSIGNNWWTGSVLNGQIDILGLWLKGLSQDELNSLYSNGSPPYINETEETNTAPSLIANSTAPVTVYSNTDWTVNLTATDPEEGYISSWVQFYNDTAKIGGEYTFNMTNNTNHLVATLGSGNFSTYDNLTAQVWLGDGTDNSSKVNLTSVMVAVSFPQVSDIIWSTTGGFTDDTLSYNQVLDYINATCSDTNLVGCNITITDPDSTVVVDNVAMTNVSSDFTYITDVTLNKAGTWVINISGHNSDGIVNGTTSNITVSIQTQSTKDGWYGYANNSYLTEAEITALSVYGYDIFEFEENMTEIQASFSTLLTSINDSRNVNIKSGINIILDFNYTNTTLKTQYLADIIENFSSFDAVPYSDSIIYISLELEDVGSYDTATKDTIVNTFAQAITDETNNAFVIYSKNHNSSGLDSSYIQYTELLYLTSSSEADFIEDQKQLFKNNQSLNRIYTQIPDAIKTKAQDFHTRIIDNLRSIPNTSSLANLDASSLNNKDVLIFNNGSSPANFTVDVSALSVSGKDVWDSTEGNYIEEDTDQTITVEVSGHNTTILYFEDLDHIQMDSLTAGTLYKGGSSSLEYSNHTDANLDGNFGMAGAYDIEIELYDKHYAMANFITYYGWLNVTSIDFGEYEVVILADKNNAELDALDYSSTSYYAYISVADYNNTDGWNIAKEVEVDNWLALNDSLNIFVDGMDSGIGGTNFSSRMKDLVDYIQVTKSKSAILNTYTAYEDFATWGNGGVMKESCVNRWNGISPSPPDNYTRENWTLELDRSEWFTAHGVDVYCQAFDNRTVDGTFTIENYTELQNIYFASKVLGYDFFYLSQPDFQYAHEEWVYDVGAKLGRNAQQLSTDTNTYYRAYENGIVYYNTTSEQGWIEDGLVVNDIQTCFYLYNPHAASPEWRFNINSRDPTGSVGEYSLTKDWSVGTWAWKCVDTTAETPINGRYLIEAWVGDHTTIVGQGYNLGWSDYVSSGTHSWYDTSTTDSFTAYPEDRNWMINMSTNISNKISIDTTPNILQTEVDSGTIKNITINSSGSFPIEIWSKPTTTSSFGNISFLNSTGSWIVLNYANNTDCDSSSPTWNTTTIESLTYKACIESLGGDTIVRVATPSLSEKVFQISSSDTTAPTLELIYPEASAYTTSPTELNFTVSDDSLDSCWYSVNDSVNISTSCSSNITGLTGQEGSNTWTIYANDSLGNENQTSVTFTQDTIVPALTVIYPESSIYTTSPTELNFTVSDDNLDSCWYSVNGSEILTNCSLNISGLTADEGENNWTVYANDSFGNEVGVSVEFTVDTTAPVITVINPVYQEDEKTQPISLVITTDENATCQYSMDSNARQSMGSGTTAFDTSATLSNGQHSVEFFCNDSLDNEGNITVIFSVNIISDTGSGSGSGGIPIVEEEPTITDGVEITLHEIEVSTEKWFSGLSNEVSLLTKDKDGNNIDVETVTFEIIEDVKFTEKTRRIDIGEYQSEFLLLEGIERVTINVTARQGAKIESTLKEVDVVAPKTSQKIIRNTKNVAEGTFEWFRENMLEVGFFFALFLVAVVVFVSSGKK